MLDQPRMDRRTFLKTVGIGLSALAAGPAARGGSRTARPNILLFFPDEHRFDWTSMNPALPDITPNLRQLAGRGVHFTNALCPSPVCAPSRACLASGREYARCGVANNGHPYPFPQKTFYSLLRDAGYHVLGCGKFDLDKPGFSWGKDGTHPRAGQACLLETWGFSAGIDNAGKMDGVNAHEKLHRPEPYFAFLQSRGLVDAFLKNYRMLDHDYPGPAVLPDDAYCDNWIGENGLRLLRAVPRGAPWFLQINFNGPHPPMDVTKSMYERWKDSTFPPPHDDQQGKGRNGPAQRRNYAAMIHNIDRWLAVFQEELNRRGERDDTIIVYCSDHGEMLGDRGLSGKSQPFHPSACVPLVVAGPAFRRSVVCEAPTQTLDLTATLLDCAGIAVPQDMDSRSLRPFLEKGGPLPRPYATSSLGNWSLVFDGRYKLIATRPNAKAKKAASRPELVLYDLKDDPWETQDLAGKRPETVDKLKPLLPPVGPYQSP
jgi:arylsulfatase